MYSIISDFYLITKEKVLKTFWYILYLIDDILWSELCKKIITTLLLAILVPYLYNNYIFIYLCDYYEHNMWNTQGEFIVDQINSHIQNGWIHDHTLDFVIIGWSILYFSLDYWIPIGYSIYTISEYFL
jgi:hypothetical protein